MKELSAMTATCVNSLQAIAAKKQARESRQLLLNEIERLREVGTPPSDMRREIWAIADRMNPKPGLTLMAEVLGKFPAESPPAPTTPAQPELAVQPARETVPVERPAPTPPTPAREATVVRRETIAPRATPPKPQIPRPMPGRVFGSYRSTATIAIHNVLTGERDVYEGRYVTAKVFARYVFTRLDKLGVGVEFKPIGRHKDHFQCVGYDEGEPKFITIQDSNGIVLFDSREVFSSAGALATDQPLEYSANKEAHSENSQDTPQDQSANKEAHQSSSPPAASANKELEESKELQELERIEANQSELQRGDCSASEQIAQRQDAVPVDLTPEEEETLRGPPIDLSLPEYLEWLATEWEAPEEDWQQEFAFVRALKAHPELRTLDWQRAFRAVEKVLCKVVIEGNLWGIVGDRAGAEALLSDAWDKVRVPLGDDLLTVAESRAVEQPLALAKEIARKRSSDYQRFISLAGWQQVANGCMPVLLGVEFTAKRLGFKRGSTISRYIYWAEADGYLVRVPGRTGKGHASKFWFNVARFSCLKDAAQNGTQKEFDAIAGQGKSS